ncbi:MAG TPA: hypothetical protein VG388_05270 [Solirubrobacteraceae bacterium]|nr:hypothetical protein [Solirubrobacteraceae bacterium]
MRSLSRACLAGVLGLAAAFLAACGAGSGLLTADQASTLKTELSAASGDISSGDCAGAARLIEKVQTQVASLPGTVDPTLVSDLSRGAQTVRSLAKTQCSGSVGTGAGTTLTTTTTPASTRPTTTSTPTSTATTTTPTTTTPDTTTTPPAPTPSTTTPATTTPGPGTTPTGGNGGAGLPGNGTSAAGQGTGQGN